MAKFTYNERFTNVQKYDNISKSYTGIKIASKLNQKNGEDYKLVDVTDLDWQGAWLAAANAYINDTYELLDAIDNIADLTELTWVKEKINELDVNVTNIINLLPSYVTKEEFDQIISQQQKALSAGAYITIDENNVISAYDLLSIADADAKFGTKDDIQALWQNFTNYYTAEETRSLADIISYTNIKEYVIKNADIRYNDLEKISNWILSQSRYIHVNYDDIQHDGSETYYIYDSETGSYIEVDLEYIINHPDEEYYIEQGLVDDITILNNRLDRVDSVLGYEIYDPQTDTSSYTEGLLNDVNIIDDKVVELRNDLYSLENLFGETYLRSNIAYNTANTAYDMAYFAYEIAITTDAYAYIAYQLAYRATYIIGEEGQEGYFRDLTPDEIELLKQDQFAIDNLYVKEPGTDNYTHAGYFDYDKYINGELDYFILIEPTESTGFYKTLDEYSERIDLAKESADNALFRLYSQTNGTSYIDLTLDPMTNEDGSNSRTIILNVDEANITYEDGLILKEGIITTYSLYNSLAYHMRFAVINND